jgi:hypothetical protein
MGTRPLCDVISDSTQHLLLENCGLKDLVMETVDPRTPDGRPLREHIMDAKLWGEIRRKARTNVALQEALDRVIIIYLLIKDQNK